MPFRGNQERKKGRRNLLSLSLAWRELGESEETLRGRGGPFNEKVHEVKEYTVL